LVNPPLTPLMVSRWVERGYKIQDHEYIKLERIPMPHQNMLTLWKTVILQALWL
jgi:hypothetical protein